MEAHPDDITVIKYQMSWPAPGDPYYTEEGAGGLNLISDEFSSDELLIGFGTLVHYALDKDSKVKPDIVADFHRIPFENNYFDVVLTFDTIEHTKNPKDFVREIQRVVKPNGVILIACNDFDIQPQNWSADSTYATYINHKILKKLLEPMGFFVFSLYRGYLVAVNKPRKGDKIFSIFYALYKRPLKIIKKFFFVNQ